MQERFREPNDPANHMALAFELKGILQTDKMQKAFELAWERADLGNFRFDLNAGTQWLGEKIPLCFEFQKVREAEVKKILTENFERNFDLLRESPLRLSLFQLKEDKCILGIVAHHIALDGWSLARFLETSCDLYNALVRGEALPPIPWQSYWKYLEQVTKNPPSETNRNFWQGQKFSSLPLPETKGKKGQRVIYIFNKKYYQKIREAAKAKQVTPFLFLLACFSQSLGKVLKRDKHLLSIPFALRDFEGAEFVLGNCVNLLPLEVNLQADDFFKAIREAYLDRFSHASLPFAEIQKMHESDLSLLHFNFEPSVEEPDLEGMQVDFYPYPISKVEKPIIINVNDTKKTYYVEIDYQVDALQFVQALTIFTETERFINQHNPSASM